MILYILILIFIAASQSIVIRVRNIAPYAMCDGFTGYELDLIREAFLFEGIIENDNYTFVCSDEEEIEKMIPFGSEDLAVGAIPISRINSRNYQYTPYTITGYLTSIEKDVRRNIWFAIHYDLWPLWTVAVIIIILASFLIFLFEADRPAQSNSEPIDKVNIYMDYLWACVLLIFNMNNSLPVSTPSKFIAMCLKVFSWLMFALIVADMVKEFCFELIPDENLSVYENSKAGMFSFYSSQIKDRSFIYGKSRV